MQILTNHNEMQSGWGRNTTRDATSLQKINSAGNTHPIHNLCKKYSSHKVRNTFVNSTRDR